MKKFIRLGVIFILFTGWFSLPLSAGNVSLQNPSFEELTGDLPAGWKPVAYKSESGNYLIRSEAGDAHSGVRSVVIINYVDNDTRLIQDVVLEAATIYKFSCWVKVPDISLNGKGANISISLQAYTSNDVKDTTGTWQELSLYLVTGEDEIKTTITLGLGGYGMMYRGEAYFDDVSIEPVTSVPAGMPVVDFRTKQEVAASVTKDSAPAIEIQPATQPEKKIHDRGIIKWRKPDLYLIILCICTGTVILLGAVYYLILAYRIKNKESAQV